MDEPKISEESEATVKGKDGIMRGVPNDYVSDEDLHDDEETGLTAKERKRKQRKKRRNTLLDQRIARDNVTAEEKKEADQNVVRKLAVNGTLIGLWYLFSLCISLVSLRAFARFSRGLQSLTVATVQQVDVRHAKTKLSIPLIYNVCTHACAILFGSSGALLCAIVTTSQCTAVPSRIGFQRRGGAGETINDQNVLFDKNRALRCGHRS